MKLSRREFLGGIVAGALAAVAVKLPKMAEPKHKGRSIAGTNATMEINGHVISRASVEPQSCQCLSACITGACPNGYELNRSMGQLTLSGDYSATIKPGSRLSMGWTGDAPAEIWTVQTVRSNEDCTVLGVWPRGQYS